MKPPATHVTVNPSGLIHVTGTDVQAAIAQLDASVGGGGGGGSGSSGDLHFIERLTLGAAANTIAFATNPLPTTYKHLRIVGTAKKASTDTATAGRDIRLQLNAGLNMQAGTFDAYSNGVLQQGDAATPFVAVTVVGNDYSMFTADIIDYNATQSNPAVMGGGWARTASANPPAITRRAFGQATTKTPITSLSLICGGGVNFAQVDATLYGLG